MKQALNLKTVPETETLVAQEEPDSNLRQFTPMRFEVARKEAILNMRLPTPLMNALRAKAKAKNIPYARYVRMVLEDDLAQS